MTTSAVKPDFKRLPSTVTPVHYDITLRPSLETFTFTGSEDINVVVNDDTKQIVLNSLDIQISSASFKPQNGKTISAKQIESTAETETSCISFDDSLSKGPGVLRLDFTGTINDKLKGFFISKYKSADGQEERCMAATHFEATDARRAFPCWDEPALKATFDMTLVVPTNRVALSNMNVISESVLKDNKSLKEVKFATTPVMSTYLIAYAIGDLDYVEGKTADGVVVRVYTTAGKKDQGLFALEVGTKALSYYIDYFEIAYPLPKMDLIAIPDFPIGAMENWGLVTYRETCLLVDPQNTSSVAKQNVAVIVAHELAHQWFGNLVTMDWWCDLWLKEGFATFMSYLCVDHIFSEYQIWTQFVTETTLPALEADALHNSHPIEVPVGHPSEIIEIFDAISYDKGSAVIRILHRFVGDEAFRKGLHSYLSRHSYKNAETKDLWTALEESSNKPVGDVMTTWTKQKGFPVISVKSRRDKNSLILSLTQEKFCADGKLPESEANTRWLIPISVTKSSNPTKIVTETLMDSKTFDVVVPDVSTKEWIKLNPNSVGLYRVHYSPELLGLLCPAINSKSLPPLDRLDVQNDMFALVQSGRTSTEDILKLLNTFTHEEDYCVWDSVNACLGKLNQLLSQTDCRPLFHRFGRQLMHKTYERLGWEPIKGETHLDNLLRSLILHRLVSFGDPIVISEAKKLFESHCKGINMIPPDLKGVVYRAVAIDCDDKAFDTLFKLFREAHLPEDRVRILNALGCVSDSNRITKVLDFGLSKEVRNRETITVLMAVSLTKNGRQMVWDFFKQNKGKLIQRYETGVAISRLVKHICKNFATEDKLQEVQTFFADNSFPGTERAVRQSLEEIRVNIDWLGRDLSAIQTFLSKRN